MKNEEFAGKENVTILIVDDDFLLRSFMKTALLTDGYRCECAEDGRIALDLLNRKPFDMVISDIEMPQLNGLELLHQIRAKYPDTKTLMISGKYRSTDTLNGLSAEEAHSFLTKPFSLDLFLSTVNTILFA